MTYDLFIGDRTFSSWSLRGWLMLQKFNLPFEEHLVGLYAGTMAQEMEPLAPARLVPALRTPQGDVIGESLAMAETLAERHPQAQMWPADASARSRARWLSAEMTASFNALRGDCPMQLAHVDVDFKPSDAVLTDLARIETLWAFAREKAVEGPWLFGAYSLADAFYAPVCARIIGYNLPVSDTARAYCMTTLSDPAFQHWRAEGLKVSYDPFPYAPVGKTAEWPA
ncbi:glutathione S-transferase [Sulfitobacter donghicola]|uniref:Glutathione S-transferase n=1 Tax=Sulfitobacter donghicola DSW-25 = KCTC 12864 = JCM 14565 TaxID=1300350 RepID=A0A073IHX6_9RHOB|nr:glutathione S-transferase [Sulfitobacter donghicola]KEJ89086.1 glutathione S-transferase [Sulfitobacter donghicola DSW-25 = KCTC 12864 = JCM 14565]KIN67338.1 Glutathione S-transferase family protein [Sulfitobacter donghicola DSW-25 = KCTC 12864 = JCM 14565]